MTARPELDLNADLGESFGAWRLGDDAGLLPVVTSANVACGFHAGDPATLVQTCRAAVAHGVAIGAQVGYRDLAGFGRRYIDVAPDDLYADVLYQLSALDGIARSLGGAVTYVKPHGALYNAVVHHETQASAVVRAVAAHSRARPGRTGMPVLGLPGSTLLRLAADAGLRPVTELFADRAYTSDGLLVPRTQPGAVLHDPAEIAERVARFVTDGSLVAVDGTQLDLPAESVCVHGDTPGAVEIARAVRRALDAVGVSVRAFAPATSAR